MTRNEGRRIERGVGAGKRRGEMTKMRGEAHRGEKKGRGGNEGHL